MRATIVTYYAVKQRANQIYGTPYYDYTSYGPYNTRELCIADNKELLENNSSGWYVAEVKEEIEL